MFLKWSLFSLGGKTPKLSAADVALYGLHEIIPLMSPDVLMVRKTGLRCLKSWVEIPAGPGARFSEVPKHYGPFSGVTIHFVSQEQRGFMT